MSLSCSAQKQDLHLIASFYYLNDALTNQHQDTPPSAPFNIAAFNGKRYQIPIYC